MSVDFLCISQIYMMRYIGFICHHKLDTMFVNECFAVAFVYFFWFGSSISCMADLHEATTVSESKWVGRVRQPMDRRESYCFRNIKLMKIT